MFQGIRPVRSLAAALWIPFAFASAASPSLATEVSRPPGLSFDPSPNSTVFFEDSRYECGHSRAAGLALSLGRPAIAPETIVAVQGRAHSVVPRNPGLAGVPTAACNRLRAVETHDHPIDECVVTPNRKSTDTGLARATIDAHRFDRADRGAVLFVQAGPTHAERDRKQLDREARRLARLCSPWLEMHLAWFFRSATAVDTAHCLKMGASVTVRDRIGRTPLHAAAEVTGDFNVISLLVEAGADIMARDKLNDTPLHRAARHNENREVVARLIDLGADVNAKNADRWQPLHKAADENRNPEIAALLIERGADGKTTVDWRSMGRVYEKSLWDLARRNRWARDSDWYRELQARAMEREKAEEAKRLKEIERQRKERERRIEEAKRKRLERLWAIENRRRERERLAQEARNAQDKRLAENAARIAKERQSCKPALEEIGTIGAWRKRSGVVAALKDDDGSALDAYAEAIPFLLAGTGRHAELEEAFSVRILRDADRWRWAGIEDASETLKTWISVSRLLRDNCLHEIADYLVVTVVFQTTEQFEDIAYWETAKNRVRVHPDVSQALNRVPDRVLDEMSTTGRMSNIPPMLASATAAAGKAFVAGCVDYFNAQSELRKGRGLTPVQRGAVSVLCACFQKGAEDKDHLSDRPKFTTIMAELTDPETAMSPAHNDLRLILGRCAALHGQSLK